MSALSAVSIDHAMTGMSTCSHETLANLANLVDDEEGAMTFYFDSAGTSTCSHKDEDLRLQSLISQARSVLACGKPRQDTEQELDRLRILEPRLSRHSRMFHALFVSHKNDFRHYIALPFAAEIGMLKFDRHFELLPLVRALEVCAPYAVFLVENGKARGFHVRGDHIEECEGLSQLADVSLHANDEREGWPSRIHRNAEERSERFFRQFAERARGYLWEIGSEHLVVGCRNEVWHRVLVELARIGLNQPGRFHPANFEMTPSEVLERARVAHRQLQEVHYQSFWDTLSDDPAKCTTRIEDILNHLQQGRVRKLFIGVVRDSDATECAECDSWNHLDTSICANCKGNAVHRTPVAELLLRKALLTHAEIIAPWPEQLNETRTGALLRY